ncbi:MAG: biotin--[acetyl-CoA-carboxylase] ligase [Candidatus Eremiobacteraeota bacterium]|nr:biotin--[acetyl-CoA-carboxylase] ligase [Candidatus Eremiobacteraeota bacterium]MCW5870264.1 biotin--[acetyl-CoA-carboxylase] ligase [Candidatus Eremiobacteraeota bacterium]
MSGYSLRELAECESTQDVAWDCEPGTFVVADRQTGGRGRSAGRHWFSPEGGLYMSWRLGPVEPAGFSLLGGLAVVRAVRHWGVPGWLKWPNDCWVGRAKIAGVLPDCRWRGSQCVGLVLGIGVNVCVEALPEGAVSLHRLCATSPTVAEFGEWLRGQLCELLAVHEKVGVSGYLPEVRSHSLPPGSKIAYWIGTERFEDEVVDLDDQGFLVVRSAGRLTAVDRLIPLKF